MASASGAPPPHHRLRADVAASARPVTCWCQTAIRARRAGPQPIPGVVLVHADPEPDGVPPLQRTHAGGPSRPDAVTRVGVSLKHIPTGGGRHHPCRRPGGTSSPPDQGPKPLQPSPAVHNAGQWPPELRLRGRRKVKGSCSEPERAFERVVQYEGQQAAGPRRGPARDARLLPPAAGGSPRGPARHAATTPSSCRSERAPKAICAPKSTWLAGSPSTGPRPLIRPLPVRTPTPKGQGRPCRLSPAARSW